MPRQVICRWHALGKYQPCRAHSSGLRFPAQVVRGNGIVLQQPQHTALDALQDAHPAIEHLGSDLERVVEAAEHEALRRQAQFRTGELPVSNTPSAIVGLIAVRQRNDLLLIEASALLWNENPVSDDVVEVRGTERTGIAQIVHLDRSGPVREYL